MIFPFRQNNRLTLVGDGLSLTAIRNFNRIWGVPLSINTAYTNSTLTNSSDNSAIPTRNFNERGGQLISENRIRRERGVSTIFTAADQSDLLQLIGILPFIRGAANPIDTNERIDKQIYLVNEGYINWTATNISTEWVPIAYGFIWQYAIVLYSDLEEFYTTRNRPTVPYEQLTFSADTQNIAYENASEGMLFNSMVGRLNIEVVNPSETLLRASNEGNLCARLLQKSAFQAVSDGGELTFSADNSGRNLTDLYADVFKGYEAPVLKQDRLSTLKTLSFDFLCPLSFSRTLLRDYDPSGTEVLTFEHLLHGLFDDLGDPSWHVAFDLPFFDLPSADFGWKFLRGKVNFHRDRTLAENVRSYCEAHRCRVFCSGSTLIITSFDNYGKRELVYGFVHPRLRTWMPFAKIPLDDLTREDGVYIINNATERRLQNAKEAFVRVELLHRPLFEWLVEDKPGIGVSTFPYSLPITFPSSFSNYAEETNPDEVGLHPTLIRSSDDRLWAVIEKTDKPYHLIFDSQTEFGEGTVLLNITYALEPALIPYPSSPQNKTLGAVAVTSATRDFIDFGTRADAYFNIPLNGLASFFRFMRKAPVHFAIFEVVYFESTTTTDDEGIPVTTSEGTARRFLRSTTAQGNLEEKSIEVYNKELEFPSDRSLTIRYNLNTKFGTRLRIDSNKAAPFPYPMAGARNIEVNVPETGVSDTFCSRIPEVMRPPVPLLSEYVGSNFALKLEMFRAFTNMHLLQGPIFATPNLTPPKIIHDPKIFDGVTNELDLGQVTGENTVSSVTDDIAPLRDRAGNIDLENLTNYSRGVNFVTTLTCGDVYEDGVRLFECASPIIGISYKEVSKEVAERCVERMQLYAPYFASENPDFYLPFVNYAGQDLCFLEADASGLPIPIEERRYNLTTLSVEDVTKKVTSGAFCYKNFIGNGVDFVSTNYPLNEFRFKLSRWRLLEDGKMQFIDRHDYTVCLSDGWLALSQNSRSFYSATGVSTRVANRKQHFTLNKAALTVAIRFMTGVLEVIEQDALRFGIKDFTLSHPLEDSRFPITKNEDYECNIFTGDTISSDKPYVIEEVVKLPTPALANAGFSTPPFRTIRRGVSMLFGSIPTDTIAESLSLNDFNRSGLLENYKFIVRSIFPKNTSYNSLQQFSAYSLARFLYFNRKILNCEVYFDVYQSPELTVGESYTVEELFNTKANAFHLPKVLLRNFSLPNFGILKPASLNVQIGARDKPTFVLIQIRNEEEMQIEGDNASLHPG